jgi:Fe-S cluster assembly iron-binding protein IscA
MMNNLHDALFRKALEVRYGGKYDDLLVYIEQRSSEGHFDCQLDYVDDEENRVLKAENVFLTEQINQQGE